MITMENMNGFLDLIQSEHFCSNQTHTLRSCSFWRSMWQGKNKNTHFFKRNTNKKYSRSNWMKGQCMLHRWDKLYLMIWMTGQRVKASRPWCARDRELLLKDWLKLLSKWFLWKYSRGGHDEGNRHYFQREKSQNHTSWNFAKSS